MSSLFGAAQLLVASVDARLGPWLLLAQEEGEVAPRSYNSSWAIILFSVILGLLITLTPDRRDKELKKRR